MVPRDNRARSVGKPNSSVMIHANVTLDGRPMPPGWEAGVQFSTTEPPAVIRAALDKAFAELRADVEQELGL